MVMRILYAAVLFMCGFHAETAMTATEMSRKDIPLTERYAKEIRQAEDYLSGFTSLEARFSQINPGQGTVSEGMVHISRPGRARWEYFSPHHVLTIVNGAQLSYYDFDLDQVSYAGIPATPLETLLYREASLLSDNIDVIDVVPLPDKLTITVISKEREGTVPSGESLSFVFSRKPFALTRLYRTDAGNAMTTLLLHDLRLNGSLKEELFEFKNPRLFRQKPR